jgi:hypothetical protein
MSPEPVGPGRASGLVKPTQVATHFGVPLTFVREVASDPVALD